MHKANTFGGVSVLLGVAQSGTQAGDGIHKNIPSLRKVHLVDLHFLQHANRPLFEINNVAVKQLPLFTQQTARLRNEQKQTLDDETVRDHKVRSCAL